MTKDYKLTVADVFPELLTEEERQRIFPQERSYDWLSDEGQRNLMEILKFTLPRTDESHRKQFLERDKVRLTPEDVQSVLLTPDEKMDIEERFYEFRRQMAREVFNPLYDDYQKNMDDLYDRLAREAGFDGFDANDARTGLCDWTAHRDSAFRDAARMEGRYNRLEEESSGEFRTLIRSHTAMVDWRECFEKRGVQVMLRQLLDFSRERMQRTDVRGAHILSPEQWNEQMGVLPEKQKIKMKQTITAPVTFVRNGEPHVVQVDYNLAPVLQRLSDAGYGTGQSDSGTLSDHPGYRYVCDDPMGRYAKGDCINNKNQGSVAYLTFWKPEATMLFKIGDRINTQEQINDIRRIAHEQGWTVEDSQIFYQPSLVIRLPQTYDGTSSADILKEASTRTNDLYPGLYEQDFMGWLDKRRPIEQQVIDEHGGGVRYTDDMLMKRWEKLTDALEQAQRQRVERGQEMSDSTLDRISDVNISIGGDGGYRIRCKIDGRQMLSVHLGEMDRQAIEKGLDSRRIAAEYYRDALDTNEKREQGRSR